MVWPACGADRSSPLTSPRGNIEGVRINPDALRRAREAKGLNPSQLSVAAGFARTYVHRLENGSRGTNVSAQTLTGLATALDVEPDTLVADDDPKVPSAAPEGSSGSSEHAPAEPAPNPEAWRWG